MTPILTVVYGFFVYDFSAHFRLRNRIRLKEFPRYAGNALAAPSSHARPCAYSS